MNWPPDLRLLTFAPMIDSALARLLLAHYRVLYREDDHLFGWVSLLTLFRGGFGQVPLLHGSGVRLTGPRDIAEYFDQHCDPALRLLPPGEPSRTKVEADWARFNGELAGWTARIGYFYLLPQRNLMVPVFQRGIPARERALTPHVYPALQWLFGLLLQLKPAVVADTVGLVNGALDAVDARLADGRHTLSGEGLTLADLALASALAPLALPPAYAARLPPLEAMDPALQALVASVRARAAGAFAFRIFERVGAP